MNSGRLTGPRKQCLPLIPRESFVRSLKRLSILRRPERQLRRVIARRRRSCYPPACRRRQAAKRRVAGGNDPVEQAAIHQGVEGPPPDARKTMPRERCCRGTVAATRASSHPAGLLRTHAAGRMRRAGQRREPGKRLILHALALVCRAHKSTISLLSHFTSGIVSNNYVAIEEFELGARGFVNSLLPRTENRNSW